MLLIQAWNDKEEKKLLRSTRFEIIKPTNSTWEEFGMVLSELRYKSARIANYTVQLLWQWDNYKYAYKEKTESILLLLKNCIYTRSSGKSFPM